MIGKTMPARIGDRFPQARAAIVCLAVLAAACSADAVDQGNPPRETAVSAPAYGRAIEAARARVDTVRSTARYPSVSTAILISGDLVWAEAVGYADLEDQQPATTLTQYPIGSVSKTLTAALAVRLTSAGAIDLDRGIEAYWQEAPAHFRGVTLRQLLSHQAGVRHYGFAFRPPTFSESQNNTAFESVEASLRAFIDDEPLFAPDESFQYSTYGYVLASRVMEAATGKPFLDLIEETLVVPLSLPSTEPNRANAPPGDLARRYLVPVGWGPRFDAPATDASAAWAGAGFVSTPSDLVRFGAQLQAGGYITSEQFAEMMEPRRTLDGQINEQRYGLGLRNGEVAFPRGSDSRVRILHHGGRAPGAECALLLVPTEHVTVAICGNAFTEDGSTQLVQLAADIARDFLEAASTETR